MNAEDGGTVASRSSSKVIFRVAPLTVAELTLGTWPSRLTYRVRLRVPDQSRPVFVHVAAVVLSALTGKVRSQTCSAICVRSLVGNALFNPKVSVPELRVTAVIRITPSTPKSSMRWLLLPSSPKPPVPSLKP